MEGGRVKSLKRIAIGLAVGAFTLVGLLSFSQPASAILIDQPGEDYSFDPTTSLRWLDLPLTVNFSYDEIIAGGGGLPN
jgi:hypothetical protein